MVEGEKSQFQGWHEVKERPTLTSEHIEQLRTLDRVLVVSDHAEATVGDVDILSRSQLHPTERIATVPLRRFVRETASDLHISPWDVIQQIRTLGIDDAFKLSEIEKRYKERITYVSDVHEGSEDLNARLERVIEDAPDQVLFLGDVIGTEEFSHLQNTFYQYLNNHTRGEIKLHENSQITDEELLSHSVKKPPEEGFTLKKGFLKLREEELLLAGMSTEQIGEALEDLTDETIAHEIRRYARFMHYGHYASNLPEAAKQALASGLEKNASQLVAQIKRMQQAGSQVSIIEGNWDAGCPIDFVPGIDEVKKVAPEDRIFNPKTFFETNGVSYYDQITLLPTETTLQVVLPFDRLVDFPDLSDDKKKELQAEVERARAEHKSIIVAAHGEPDWQIHNLPIPGAVPAKGSEHEKIIKGLSEAIPLIRPDQLIYGHMHNQLVNEERKILDANIKYALTITPDGSMSVESDPANFGENAVVVTYAPWKREAELAVSKVDRQRKVAGFGGTGQAIDVK